MKNYCTKYPRGNDVLKNLNFSINPGDRIAVVGRSGSGKSTFCLALLRILEASSGDITIDNVKISEINLRVLRRSISIIPQSPSLMNDTLRFNIDPLGKYSEGDILNILNSIGLDKLIKMKGGLDMMVVL